MDFQVRISETALADFRDILEYSWLNFPASAEAFGNALLNHIELLNRFPYIGSPVAGRPGVRQLVHAHLDLLPGSREPQRGGSPAFLAWLAAKSTSLKAYLNANDSWRDSPPIRWVDN